MKSTIILAILILFSIYTVSALDMNFKQLPFAKESTNLSEKEIPTLLTVDSISSGKESSVIINPTYQKFQANGGSIELNPYVDGILFEDKPIEIDQKPTTSVTTSKPSMDKILYTSKDISFEYQYLDSKLKEKIIVYSEPKIQYKYKTQGKDYLSPCEDGSFLYVQDVTWDNLFKLERPFIIGSDGKRTDLNYVINGEYLQLVGDFKSVQYPAVVDPTFAILPNPLTLPAGTGYGISFSPDNNYMAVAHTTSPRITIYIKNTSST